MVGHQFPWRTLFVQLDIEEEDDGTVDYLDFLNRFRASLRDESGRFQPKGPLVTHLGAGWENMNMATACVSDNLEEI